MESEKKQTIAVDAADKWPTAKDVQAVCVLTDGGVRLKVKIRALSRVEWFGIQKQFAGKPPPQGPQGPLPQGSDEYKQWLKDEDWREKARKVSLVAAACIKLFPGTVQENMAVVEDKLARPGQFEALYMWIAKLSGFGNEVEERSDVEMELETGEDWAKVTEAPSCFTFDHGTAAVQFLVRGVTGKKVKAIQAQCEPPLPPRRILSSRFGPMGKEEESELDLENPQYREAVERCSFRSDVLVLEQSLGFPFPGKDSEAKAAWLEQRPAGEVNALSGRLLMAASGYNARADFSLPAFSLQS